MNATQQPYDSLAGMLRLWPGRAQPHNLSNSRRDWASLLCRGMAADALPARLASIFSLCGESHRLCAQMAVAAARGTVRGDAAQAAQTLRRETLQEHVRRIGLDWPAQLLADADSHTETESHTNCNATAASLRQQALLLMQQCPLFTAPTGPHIPDLQPWLQSELLGMPADDWLLHWEQDPANWLRSWSASTPLCVAQLLQQARPQLDRAAPQSPFLRVHSSDAGLLMLADDLQRDAGFSRRPLWRGRSAETGTWTRLRQTQPERINTPWLRLGARLAELVRLALSDAPGRSGAQWLSMGSLPTAELSGLAWIEMARGLLIHQVRLDDSSASVLSAHVLAPTEWNFSAEGAVAEALEAMPGESSDTLRLRIQGLVSAYDPCVRYVINPAQETVHA